MITMEDIIREGHPTLRETAKNVAFPLTNDEEQLCKDMMEFLKNSQDPELAEKYNLRGGVGLAASQLNIPKRIIAVHIPGTVENPEPALSTIMINPKVVSHSIQDSCLAEGEGCLSVDREVPGYVVRHTRITVQYADSNGTQHKIRLKNYAAIVVQHEIDHTNGVMFYDHINQEDPYKISQDVTLIS
ncbi:peptide deformylase [Carnobacterium gallinarum]|uniref:peptide deformylase n=1 Tax=Carnobacterium gallinarum TaxID=2749 RepID=UPI0005506B7D|nr:peptide deformylase [Carnobacterium gallinarum]